MAQNIKLFKLLNGQEIIAEVLDESLTKIKIKNPVAVMVIPSKTDPKTPTVGFAPWVEFSEDKEFIIDSSHIVVKMNPINEFVTQYNSMFGGIVLPPSISKLIVPKAGK